MNDQLIKRIELLTQDISRAEVRNTQLKNDLVKNNQLIKIKEAKLVQAEGDAKQKCLEMEKKIEEYKQKVIAFFRNEYTCLSYICYDSFQNLAPFNGHVSHEFNALSYHPKDL